MVVSPQTVVLWGDLTGFSERWNYPCSEGTRPRSVDWGRTGAACPLGAGIPVGKPAATADQVLLQKLVCDAFVENRVSIFQRVTAVKNRTF
jgi:hypothetical protein